MGRMYSINIDQFNYTTAAGGGSAFTFVGPADAITVVHSCRIGQSSDAGDVLAAMLDVTLGLYIGADGTGGAVFVPIVLEAGSALYGGTARVNDVTTSAATPTLIIEDTFNVQAGWLYLPTPSERIIVSPSDKFVVEVGTPVSDITVNGSLVIEEIGG